jgi:parallel beta-helix repeat protein
VNSKGPFNSNNDNLWIRNASYITIEGLEVHSAARAGIAIQGEPTAEVHGIVIRNNFCHNNSRWGIFTGYAEGIRIEDNETSYSAIEHGIYVSNSSDNPVIRRNQAHHNNASGIQINADPSLPGDGIISNAVVESNEAYNNGAAGGAAINLASVTFSMVRNNLLYNNSAGGIAGWDDGSGTQWGTHNNKFYNNTIVQPSNGRFVMSLLNGSTNNEIKNSILLHLGTRGSINVDSSSEPGLDSDYNAVVNVFSYNDGSSFVSLSVWQSRGHDTHSFLSTTSALFTNAAGNDYHLKAGSPAIDAGIPLDVPDDLDGNSRPQGAAYDLGCYESAVSCSDSSPPFTSLTAPANNSTVSGTITISADAGDDCAVTKVEFYVDGNLISSDTSAPYSISWNTASVNNGSHSLTSRAFDATSKSSVSTPVNVNVNNTVFFSDDFEDGNASGWTFTAGTWSVINGDLTGTVRKGDALSPNFGGCTACSIETDLKIQTSRGRVSVLGWYQNSTTYVELQVYDDKNKLILKQFSAGSTVATGSVGKSISPNTYYHIKLVYNGSRFEVFVDGTLILTLASGSTPFGTAGFRVWSPNKSAVTGSFRGVVVY